MVFGAINFWDYWFSGNIIKFEIWKKIFLKGMLSWSYKNGQVFVVGVGWDRKGRKEGKWLNVMFVSSAPKGGPEGFTNGVRGRHWWPRFICSPKGMLGTGGPIYNTLTTYLVFFRHLFAIGFMKGNGRGILAFFLF